MKSLGNVFILGDSYSTFEGFIPEGFNPYYTKAGHENTDVNRVEQTWWYPIIEETGSHLLLNSSWSGTTICHTGYSGDCSGNSFVTRLDKLIEEGFFKENRIDTFFLFGGTNDSWADSPLGEIMYDGWTREDLFSVLPAIGYLFSRISDNFKDTRVICIINTPLKPEIENGLEAACEKYGIEFIKLGEVAKQHDHPTISGMRQIKEQVTKFLDK